MLIVFHVVFKTNLRLYDIQYYDILNTNLKYYK